MERFFIKLSHKRYYFKSLIISFRFSRACPVLGKPRQVFKLVVPHRETVFWLSERLSRIGKVPNRFQNARPASGNRVLLFWTIVPHRESHFPFSFGPLPRQESPSKFPLALSRVRTAISDFIWRYPASGHPHPTFRRPSPASGQPSGGGRPPCSLLVWFILMLSVSVRWYFIRESSFEYKGASTFINETPSWGHHILCANITENY